MSNTKSEEILLVISDMQNGGTQKIVRELFLYWKNNGYKIKIITFDKKFGSYNKSIKKFSVSSLVNPPHKICGIASTLYLFCIAAQIPTVPGRFFTTCFLYLNFYNNKKPIKTASDFQARSKIYNSSIDSWKNYEKYLNKYFTKLKN